MGSSCRTCSSLLCLSACLPHSLPSFLLHLEFNALSFLPSCLPSAAVSLSLSPSHPHSLPLSFSLSPSLPQLDPSLCARVESVTPPDGRPGTPPSTFILAISRHITSLCRLSLLTKDQKVEWEIPQRSGKGGERFSDARWGFPPTADENLSPDSFDLCGASRPTF